MNVASRQCSIEGCENRHKARGFCATHYTRWHSNGDPLIVRPNHFVRGGGYDAIHKWLHKHYGPADKCENIACLKESKTYHWAKVEDKEHEHKRENYIMLCASCHRLYDQRPDWIQRMAVTLSKRTDQNYCRNGHLRTPETTYWAKRRLVISPVCRVCHKESQRRYVCKSQI